MERAKLGKGMHWIVSDKWKKIRDASWKRWCFLRKEMELDAEGRTGSFQPQAALLAQKQGRQMLFWSLNLELGPKER